jgi:hypothetical protein
MAGQKERKRKERKEGPNFSFHPSRVNMDQLRDLLCVTLRKITYLSQALNVSSSE